MYCQKLEQCNVLKESGCSRSKLIRNRDLFPTVQYMLSYIIVSCVGFEPALSYLVYDVVFDSFVDFNFLTPEPEHPKATCVAAKPWTIVVLLTIT